MWIVLATSDKSIVVLSTSVNLLWLQQNVTDALHHQFCFINIVDHAMYVSVQVKSGEK